MLAKLASLLFMALLGLLLFGLLLWWLQPRMIFFPSERLVASPTDWGLGYEEVQDEIVPARLGRRLYDAAAPAPKRFVELRGCHNEGFLHSQPHYQAALVSFLDQRPASDAGD